MSKCKTGSKIQFNSHGGLSRVIIRMSSEIKVHLKLKLNDVGSLSHQSRSPHIR